MTVYELIFYTLKVTWCGPELKDGPNAKNGNGRPTGPSGCGEEYYEI
ncbi:MAG TPA: hypothetical protein VH415_07920 [Nitrososphaeraceae archaeon]